MAVSPDSGAPDDLRALDGDGVAGGLEERHEVVDLLRGLLEEAASEELLDRRGVRDDPDGVGALGGRGDGRLRAFDAIRGEERFVAQRRGQHDRRVAIGVRHGPVDRAWHDERCELVGAIAPPHSHGLVVDPDHELGVKEPERIIKYRVLSIERSIFS